MGLTGDFKKFAELQDRIKAISKAGALDKVAARMGATAMKLTADEFKQSVDPSGKPWKPVVRNRPKDRRAKGRRARRGLAARPDKPLVDTGRLKGSIANGTAGNTVRIFLPVTYAPFHQFGTKHIAQRKILPTGKLPERWLRPMVKDADAVLRNILKGK